MRSLLPNAQGNVSRCSGFRWWTLCALTFVFRVLLGGISPAGILAQQPEAPYTLHVYANLVQIPTLVLSPRLKPLPPLEAERFDISLDAGPLFHPTHIRLEGDDPITLDILLDVSGDVRSLMPELSESIAGFADHSLRPHDHVSLYALDCNLIRTANDMPAGDGDKLKQAFDAVLAAPPLHEAPKNGRSCVDTLPLWNSMAVIARSLAEEPGRRVILLASQGYDLGNQVRWSELEDFVTLHSITIFGMLPEAITNNTAFERKSEANLDALAQTSGGMLFYTSRKAVPVTLTRILDSVRGRYILEFPRPTNGALGRHNMKVTLTRENAFIRPAGINIPVQDPAILADPTTLRSAPSPAIIGPRHPPGTPN